MICTERELTAGLCNGEGENHRGRCAQDGRHFPPWLGEETTLFPSFDRSLTSRARGRARARRSARRTPSSSRPRLACSSRSARTQNSRTSSSARRRTRRRASIRSKTCRIRTPVCSSTRNGSRTPWARNGIRGRVTSAGLCRASRRRSVLVGLGCGLMRGALMSRRAQLSSLCEGSSRLCIDARGMGCAAQLEKQLVFALSWIICMMACMYSMDLLIRHEDVRRGLTSSVRHTGTLSQWQLRAIGRDQ